jgi:hypothetical protein
MMTLIRRFLSSGGFMAATLFATGAADQTYSTGPETLIADSTTILAGPISALSKQIVSTSEPPGPDAIPIKWIIAGLVDSPTPLKGSGAGPVTFSRPEQSLLLPPSRDGEDWVRIYGDFQEGDQVVLFLNGDRSLRRALPSGSGERDLISLVRDIIALQSGMRGEPRQAWLSYLNGSPLDQGRQAALRVLVQMPIEWTQLSPALDRLIANASMTDKMRAFSFGIVVFGLTHDRWKADQVAVSAFLCRQFESERRPRLLLQYVLSLKVALQYTMEEATRSAREPERKRIVDCLKRRESTAPMTPEVADQYRQIRATYPGII